jgi:hypothetical protein
MHTDRRHASFLSRWTRGRPACATQDAADYGTAFGLELSVGDPPAQAPLRTEHPLARRQPASTTAGWWARWWRRTP